MTATGLRNFTWSIDQFQESRAIRRRFADALVKSLPERRPNDDDAKALLLGQRDAVREDKLRVEAALNTSGLPEFWSQRESSREKKPAAVD